MNVTSDDIQEYLLEHCQELTNEELIDLVMATRVEKEGKKDEFESERDPRQEQKDLQPLSILPSTCTYNNSLLNGQGATDFHAKIPEKKRENWARGPLMFLGAWETKGAPRDRAGYLPPSW